MINGCSIDFPQKVITIDEKPMAFVVFVCDFDLFWSDSWLRTSKKIRKKII